MDYTQILSISAVGMTLERTRLEAAALNLANADSRVSSPNQAYRPKRVFATAFPSIDVTNGIASMQEVAQPQMVDSSVPPKAIYDAADPRADSAGFVYVPDINPVEEMLAVMAATRSFEANVRVMESSRSMLLRALEIGSGR